MAPGERLQKVLARVGQGSRRQLESRIRAGEVRVNRTAATLGQQVFPGDLIQFHGRTWRATESGNGQVEPTVIMYHKPVGEICSRNDPEGRPTVFERLPRLAAARWVAVGRLDINTSGLLLFTTDGELANRLMHPRGALDREYLARVQGPVTERVMAQLLAGVRIDGARAAFESIRPQGDKSGEGRNRWYRVIVREGRYRMVRRLWESQNCRVSRLVRIGFGPLTLPRDLGPGRWRDLAPAQLEQLVAETAPTSTQNPAR